MKENIETLIEQIIPFCESWIKKSEDGLDRFVDPNDGVEISAHYGATHAAAAFIIWGKQKGNDAIYRKGLSLLDSILKRWDISMNLPEFHYDFNNLALCLAEEYVDNETRDLIRKAILKTSDSNHDTINWLPMRWIVNKKRIEWSSDDKYQNIINRCKATIAKATNTDGGIEDRLPRGLSFNLQYDLATVAVLQYLNVHGENLNLSKEIGFLLNAVAPDGDINYQGRGSNQVFAWGLWIYLLASSCQNDVLKPALGYFSHRLPLMLEHNNMMLNEWDGAEKYLWWDYHYASVYTSHCLLWLILAYVDFNKKAIKPITPTNSDTGLHIYRSENFFVSWFEGRIEYLAEKGPAIAAIWSKKQGVICKGMFGPWQGPFGNMYIFEDVILKNFCGLLEVGHNNDWSKNRYVHKLFPSLKTEVELKIKPIFSSLSVKEDSDGLVIFLNNSRKREMMVNILATREIEMSVYCDNHPVKCSCVEYVRNQYDWCRLYQSRTIVGKTISIRFL